MLEAITYRSMLDDLEENKSVDKFIGALFTRPKSATGRNILYDLPYYHHRSSQTINFYLPGYGAYWYGTYPDERNVVKINNIQWSFSNQKYVEFISDFENESKWNYSGESELLLICYRNNSLDFSNVIKFRLDAMLKDNAISSIQNFFEIVIKEATKRSGINQFSDMVGIKALGKVIGESLMNYLPDVIKGIYQHGRHYVVKDYSKNNL